MSLVATSLFPFSGSRKVGERDRSRFSGIDFFCAGLRGFHGDGVDAGIAEISQESGGDDGFADVGSGGGDEIIVHD